jgi:hypothetical protein
MVHRVTVTQYRALFSRMLQLRVSWRRVVATGVWLAVGVLSRWQCECSACAASLLLHRRHGDDPHCHRGVSRWSQLHRRRGDTVWRGSIWTATERHRAAVHVQLSRWVRSARASCMSVDTLAMRMCLHHHRVCACVCVCVCTNSYYCPPFSELPTPCESGSFNPNTSQAVCSGVCPSGWYCPAAATSPRVRIPLQHLPYRSLSL